jgi:methionyl-tRNA formyltransferase
MGASTNTSDVQEPVEELASSQPLVPQVRVVFMGTPTLSAELFTFLCEKGFNIVGVVTKGDKPTGRDQEVAASPVKEAALLVNVPVLTPVKLNEETLKEIAALTPDLIVVAAYGKILPEALLSLPGLGCLNVHYSLLPRFRGASPIQHSLLFGDTETGVTLMKMDQGLDTGDIIATRAVAIEKDDTTLSLTPRLNSAAKELLAEALPLWIKQKIKNVPQPEEGVTLCQLIERADGKIEWTNSAQDIYNRYRAFTPWPGVFCFWKKKNGFLRLKLLSLHAYDLPTEKTYRLGEVFEVEGQIAVATSDGIIILEEVQLEGKTKMPLRDFLNGNPDFIGSFLV